MPALPMTKNCFFGLSLKRIKNHSETGFMHRACIFVGCGGSRVPLPKQDSIFARSIVSAKDDPLKLFKKAVDNVKPALEVKSRRVGGATYQVPMEVPPGRQLALAMRWIVGYAQARKNVPLMKALASELKEAAAGQGNAIKKRDDTHKMAQANRAFAHFRF